MSVSALMLAACLGSTAADAPVEEPPPLEPSHNFLLAGLETIFVDVGILAFNNAATRQGFAQVSLDTIASHFDGRRPWFFDTDYFFTNQFGHPYQGSLSFTAARSAGFGFWLSSLAPFMSSLGWELFCEVDPPSVNDQISTTLGGIFLGEVLHRTALMFLERGGDTPSIWRHLAAFLIEPAGEINRGLFNHELDARDVDANPPFFGVAQAGVTAASFVRDYNSDVVTRTGPQFSVNFELVYGLPGDPTWRYSIPFSHFDLTGAVTLPNPTRGSFFIRGLLVGAPFGAGPRRLKGLAGLYGIYDFAGLGFARVSTTAVGPGGSAQLRLSENVYLQGTVVLAAIGYGTMGLIDGTDPTARDYHVGPGVQGMLEARLIYNQVGMFRATVRNYFVFGAYVPPSGFENVAYLNVSLLVRLFGDLGAALEADLAHRQSLFADASYERASIGVTFRVMLSYMGTDFGIVEPLRR